MIPITNLRKYEIRYANLTSYHFPPLTPALQEYQQNSEVKNDENEFISPSIKYIFSRGGPAKVMLPPNQSYQI